MTAFDPRREDLPEEFPVFPLTGALLLPRGRLPLNIFEPRYLALVEDALAAGRMFGMIQPDPRGMARDGGPALYGVGCLGRLSSFSETEDGRYLITLTGVIRFGVRQESAPHRGYRRVRAHFNHWWNDLGPQSPPPEIGRERLMAALRAYFTVRGFAANWDAIEQMSDEELVTTLSMVCPFDPAEKQALLEAPGPAERAQTLFALLQMGSAASDDGAAPSRSVS